VLGFEVSSTEQSGLLKPIFSEAPVWLTGGQFRLEASVLGLVCIVIVFVLFQRWDASTAL